MNNSDVRRLFASLIAIILFIFITVSARSAFRYLFGRYNYNNLSSRTVLSEVRRKLGEGSAVGRVI